MIITSDKVGMSSTREYSWNMSQNSKTSTQMAGGLFGSIANQSYERSYSSKQQYDSYSYSSGYQNALNESDNPDGFPDPKAYLEGAFIYSNMKTSGYYGSITGTTTLGIESVTMQAKNSAKQTSTTAALGSTSPDYAANTLADFKRQTVFSLLDLIRNFKLRSLFDEESGFKDNVLTMTNRSDAATWTIESNYSSAYTEKETTSFSSNGTVQTADGRTIDFQVNLEMSREYMEKNELNYMSQYTSVLTDPLVINLTDAPATLGAQTFLFDIDGDGTKEEHASLGAGSGFLALDKNKDGSINDGSELFGTKSGNGFSDLAAYDSDQNGWIDEADEIYQDLRVWTKDKDGKDVLLSLKAADVGAIYLGSSRTDFSITDDTNTTKAKVRQTGIYLHEDGRAGSVQQVDI